MVSSGKGELVVRSRLKQLVAKLETEKGERILQRDIAQATGLSENAVSRWMSPKPFSRIETEAAARLCEFLDVELGELLYLDRARS